MESPSEKLIKRAQVAGAGTGDQQEPTADATTVYPDNFANQVGWLAAVNSAIDAVASKYSPQGINARNLILQHKIREQLYTQYIAQENSAEYLELKNKLTELGYSDPHLVNTASLASISSQLEAKSPPGDQNTQDIINQINSYIGNQQPVTQVESQITENPYFKKDVRNIQLQKSKQGVPVAASTNSIVIVSQQLQEQAPENNNPISVDKFRSLNELKAALIDMGPKPETYNKIFEMVGPENEDSAKGSLAKFYEGSPAGLNILYDLLIKAGAASPVDEEIVGELMQKHPQVFEDKENNKQPQQPAQPAAPVTAMLKKASLEFGEAYVLEAEDGKTITVKNDWDFVTLANGLGSDAKDIDSAITFLAANEGKQLKVAGYFDKYEQTVASFNGLHMSACSGCPSKIEKVASGGVGSTTSGGAYQLYGPDEKRMCPKIRNVVSTFTCRYHCLDGLAINDHQIICGEAVWRENVMDKFSSDFVNAEGKLEGGYLRARFEVDSNTHEHPALLKPGQRAQPINEDAWSTEKRLVEVRKSEGEKRGYEGVYEPKDVYNFDQHKLVKGPETPELAGKEKDPIAKMASVKVAASARDPLGENESAIAGMVCPKCKAKFKQGISVCPHCKMQNQIYYMSQALQDTNAIPAPSITASYANGVYKVTIGKNFAFGSTIAEAQAKIVPDGNDSVNELEGKLSDVIQTEQPAAVSEVQDVVPQQNPQQPQVQQVQQVLPQNQGQPTVIKSPMLDPTQMAPQDQLPIIPQPLENMEEGEPTNLLEDEDQTHIGADVLDSHLESSADPVGDIQERTSEFAQYGLGPESKETK